MAAGYVSSAIPTLSVAVIRKVLADMRERWHASTPANPLFICDTLYRQLSIQDFASQFVLGKHLKRHNKSLVLRSALDTLAAPPAKADADDTNADADANASTITNAAIGADTPNAGKERGHAPVHAVAAVPALSAAHVVCEPVAARSVASAPAPGGGPFEHGVLVPALAVMEAIQENEDGMDGMGGMDGMEGLDGEGVGGGGGGGGAADSDSDLAEQGRRVHFARGAVAGHHHHQASLACALTMVPQAASLGGGGGGGCGGGPGFVIDAVRGVVTIRTRTPGLSAAAVETHYVLTRVEH